MRRSSAWVVQMKRSIAIDRTVPRACDATRDRPTPGPAGRSLIGRTIHPAPLEPSCEACPPIASGGCFGGYLGRLDERRSRADSASRGRLFDFV
jgi:hypothetical protein